MGFLKATHCVTYLRVKCLTKLVQNSFRAFLSMVDPLTLSIKVEIMLQLWVTKEEPFRSD